VSRATGWSHRLLDRGTFNKAGSNAIIEVSRRNSNKAIVDPGNQKWQRLDSAQVFGIEQDNLWVR
jgi:hypothetical protein